jgi:hypothetical protein
MQSPRGHQETQRHTISIEKMIIRMKEIYYRKTTETESHRIYEDDYFDDFLRDEQIK